MTPVDQYRAIVTPHLVDEYTFLEGRKQKVVHQSWAEREYMKDGKKVKIAYWVLGVVDV